MLYIMNIVDYSSSINNLRHEETSSKVEDASKLNRGQQLLLQRAKNHGGFHQLRTPSLMVI